MIRFRLSGVMADKGFNEGRKITFDEISRATLTKVANQKGITRRKTSSTSYAITFGCRLKSS